VVICDGITSHELCNDNVTNLSFWTEQEQSPLLPVYYSLHIYDSGEYWIYSMGHAFGYNSAKTEPIWMKSEALWVHCRGLALADCWRDMRSSDSWRARWNFVVFCQVSNARCHRFPIGQISRNLQTKRRSASRWKVSEQNFKNFTVKGSRGTVHGSSMARWKVRGRLPISANWIFR